MRPVVAGANKIVFKPGFDGLLERRVSDPQRDHDLQLVYSGKGSVVADDVEYPLQKGDVFTIYPGEKFFVRTTGDKPFCRYYVHFDFYEGKNRLSTPVVNDKEPWPRLIHLHDDMRIRELFADLVFLLTEGNDRTMVRMIANGIFTALIGLITLQYQQADYSDINQPKSHRGVRKAERFILDNYRRHMTLAGLAQIAGLSMDYFGQIFKTIFGKTPIDYLVDYRLQQAKKLMVETELNISEIAAHVGYEDIHYFSYLFKHREGVTPSEFISRFSCEE